MTKKDESYILKKTREELGTEPWRTQYPSTTVSWRLNGDMSYCEQFRGEAKVMLYNLKNRMNLSASLDPVYRLKSLQDIRHYNDGTVIIVKSVYGQDFIEINAGAGIPSCSIILFDVPLTVQPMHWYTDGIHDAEWVIANPGGELEVEGVDYIKTYYSYHSKDCITCILDLSVCDTNDLQTTYGWFAPQTCKPFVFENIEIPVNETYLNDHCIHGTCQAEIIEFGKDEQGTYFLWKVYTEWSSLGPAFADFTKTGLGYLLLRAFINLGGVELCTSESSIVMVDCCLKALVDRTPVIYWEKCIGGGWCVAPSTGTIETDLDYFWIYGGWIYMVLWAKENWCRPMTWNVSGIGELTHSEGTEFAYYRVPYVELGDLLTAAGCEGSVTITIEGSDRCGTKDSITFTSTPCCDDAATLEMGYTTLAMSCSGSQTLTAVGGCAPYSWGLSGGGTITPAEDTLTALYQAAATNAECANNATITLTDCCGGSDSIQIAVNCYTTDVAAYTLLGAWFSAGAGVCANASCGCNGVISGCAATYKHQHYHCDGTLHADWGSGNPCAGSTTCTEGGVLQISPCTPIGTLCGTLYGDPCNYITVEGKKCWAYNCDPPTCQNLHPCGYTCSTISAVMKTAGCCPINPYTGLPF